MKLTHRLAPANPTAYDKASAISQFRLSQQGGHCGPTKKRDKPLTDSSLTLVGAEGFEPPTLSLRDSNPRPSACKADALNQLS